MTLRLALWPLLVLCALSAQLSMAADTLAVGQRLQLNQYLESNNGKYRFYLQSDGNLVLRDWATRNALWASDTHGQNGSYLAMQSDGNLVLYTAARTSVWSSKTHRTAARKLVLQDDANLVLYTDAGQAVWATGTVQTTPVNPPPATPDPLVETLRQIRAASGTIVLDWDNTIDIDSDYTVGRTAPRWMDAFAEAGVDAWLVTGNGNTSRIESAVMAVVKSDNRSYWSNLLRNKAFYSQATGAKDAKYEQIIGSRPKWQFMIADDASANIDDFQRITSGQGYLYRPRTGYATYDEMSQHLGSFLRQLQAGEPAPSAGIQHIGTTQLWDSDGLGMSVARPSGVRAGDLLVLALHRTDDVLPFNVSGWKRMAECYKEDNGYACQTVANCTTVSGNFCDRFSGKYRGRDLAQVIFYRVAGSSEPSAYSFNLNKSSTGGHPGWAILTTLRGANTTNPLRSWAHRGCDNHQDSLFPSVDGRRGDMLLLSQSFDDAVSQSKFGAPVGTTTLGYVSRSDEAGFLFGGILTRDGQTGDLKTQGDGASSCKDALVSLTIRPN